MIPKRMYLCGGGINVIAHIGVLKELQRRFMLRNVREWIGVSAGALMALCLVIGFTLVEIEQVYIKFDFTNISDIDSAPGWIINYGMDTGNKLRKLIEACLHIKGISETVTFKELYDLYRISYRIFVTDLHDAKLIQFSAIDTPDRCIVEAVQASMSIPYYFQPVIDSTNSHILMDGGVISNYPLFMLSEKELGETLGIYLRTGPAKIEELQLHDFALRPLQLALSMRGQYEAQQYAKQTIVVHLGPRSPIHLTITEEEKLEMIKMGVNATVDFYKSKYCKPVRRYSVG
jgi:NTE family protein